jgi:hypothetical protein
VPAAYRSVAVTKRADEEELRRIHANLEAKQIALVVVSGGMID